MRRRFMNNKRNMPLSFIALEDGFSISFSNTILYSINGGAWNTFTRGGIPIVVNKDSTISFKKVESILESGVGQFFISKACNVFGNCSSLLPNVYDDQFMTKNLYCNLFRDCSTILDASGLILPATTLSSYCYYNMFQGCTALTTAPELPATTLAWGCYSNMFFNCTSLTTAPELPATTLADYCYYNMFQGCGKLNYIKMLATDISASKSLNNWVSGVASSGTFVKNPAMTSLPTGVSGIPSGWTVVNDGEESGGGNLITFYIADSAGLRPTLVEYQAIEGMTWGEWVDSKYNTIGIYIGVYDSVLTPDGFGITSHVGVSQKSNIVIISGEEYELG